MASEIAEIRETLSQIDKLNIIITGKTGVGKSTLINSIFGEHIKTGVGKPQTQHTTCYTKKGSPLNLFDTKGLELNNMAEIEQELKRVISNHRTTNPKDHIHMAWYCINNNSKRLEDAEIRFIKSLCEQVKVIIVLTQSYKKDSEMFNEIKKQLPSLTIIEVMAQTMNFPTGPLTAWGLQELVATTTTLLPECAKDGAISASTASAITYTLGKGLIYTITSMREEEMEINASNMEKAYTTILKNKKFKE